MASERVNVGQVIATVGVIIFVAVLVAGFFGRFIPFFTENLFIPILMIFVGRAMARRTARRRAEDQDLTPPERPEPVRRPRPAPPPRRPEPRPRSEAVEKEPLEPESAKAEERPVAKPRPPVPLPPGARPTVRPKTSDEMIAEAKERLRRRSG